MGVCAPQRTENEFAFTDISRDAVSCFLLVAVRPIRADEFGQTAFSSFVSSRAGASSAPALRTWPRCHQWGVRAAAGQRAAEAPFGSEHSSFSLVAV